MVLNRSRAKLHRTASRIHKWLALIVGAQLLLWFASGALMSYLPIGDVRGEHLVDRDLAAPLPRGMDASAMAKLLDQLPSASTALRIVMVDGRAVALAEGPDDAIRRFDTRTGAAMPPFDAAAAQRIAKAAWRGATNVETTASLVTTESTEYRGRLPAWQVQVSDPDATRIYVEAHTGRIAAVRTSTWRLYDFFWGLHIMDWSGHENFNTPWLLAFAIGGLALALAGTVLLAMRWPLRRHRRGPPAG